MCCCTVFSFFFFFNFARRMTKVQNLSTHREAFAGFDPNVVGKMGEKEITDIASDKEIMLAESRVRCIVDNAKCILKVTNGQCHAYIL